MERNLEIEENLCKPLNPCDNPSLQFAYLMVKKNRVAKSACPKLNSDYHIV